MGECDAERILQTSITVCSECEQASCWQGIFMCDRSKNAGVKRVTVAYLAKNSEEHPSYWKTDKELQEL